MFAVMYKTEEGKVIRTCKTLDEAQELANNTACMGYSVTVFDYDVDSQTRENIPGQMSIFDYMEGRKDE